METTGYISPRYDFCDRPNGYRACASNVAGCVVILLDADKAADMIAIAIRALDEDGDLNSTAN